MNWLYNKGFIIFLFVELLSEIIHFLGKNPSFGKEVVLSWKHLMHSHKIFTKIVFSS